MIITLVKKQKGISFINEMERTYNSLEELEKLYERTGNMKLYVEIENWKYYLQHPEGSGRQVHGRTSVCMAHRRFRR